MNSNLELAIPPEWLEQIKAQAEQEYPREACGVILGLNKHPNQLIRLIPCRNIADELHVQDPKAFPRTAAQAYWIDPKDLFNIHKIMRETNTCLRIIYHSHVDHPSQFSKEDARMAIFEGGPIFPDTLYAILSVQKGKAMDLSLYGWNDIKKSYELQSCSRIEFKK